MTQALILVDIQNDYFNGGTMELVGMDEAGANARSVLDAFRADGDPIFHIQHVALKPVVIKKYFRRDGVTTTR